MTRPEGETVDIVLAVHGILTGRSWPTWPERLEQALEADDDHRAVVLTDHYRAGPFPRINWFHGNPKRAKALTRVLVSWVKAMEDKGNPYRIHLIGHSNGSDLCRRVAIQLGNRGIRVESLLMVSAPSSRSLKRLGLETLYRSRRLNTIGAYAAGRDGVLSKDPSRMRTLPGRFLIWMGAALRWPYGNLGKYGFDDHEPVERLNGYQHDRTERLFQRYFPAWGHGDFFPGDDARKLRRDTVIKTIRRDLNWHD